MPQFTPRRSRPLCRETYLTAADSWSRLCSQLDDYARAGNAAGITRVLNRLHRNVRVLRDRHLDLIHGGPHAADDYDAAQAETITREDLR